MFLLDKERHQICKSVTKVFEFPVCENKVFAKLFNEVTNHDNMGTVLDLFKNMHILAAKFFCSMHLNCIILQFPLHILTSWNSHSCILDIHYM